MGRPQKDEVVNGLTVSYLTSENTAIDWDELSYQVLHICSLSHENLSTYASYEYVNFVKSEQTALSNCLRFLTGGLTLLELQTHQTGLDDQYGAQYHQLLTEYNHLLATFGTVLECNISSCALVMDRFIAIKEVIEEMRERINECTATYPADPPQRAKIERGFDLLIFALSNFKRTTNELQMGYRILYTERKSLLQQTDTSINLAGNGSPLFQLIKACMITTDWEMEGYHRVYLSCVRSARIAFEGCLDWMLRKQKFGYEIVEKDMDVDMDGHLNVDGYALWLARLDQDGYVGASPDVWEWNDQYVGVEEEEEEEEEGTIEERE